MSEAIPPAAPTDTDIETPESSKEIERVLCGHCGRTASNGISCQGICVADSGY
ncbi:MAG: hypothetical protein O2922_10185 [Cyanobacteria bacterium]|nr:hypothetical protein [Cyanobacteriota bacterium]